MTCSSVRQKLSGYLDGELEASAAQAVSLHLDTCESCRARWQTLRAALDALQDLPRMEPRESLAGRVRDRLEVERRGPGLAMLFRPAWAARPLILPSLLPAAAAVILILGASLLMGRDPRPAIATDARGRSEVWANREPRSGTEGNPLFPSSGVAMPRPRSDQRLPDDVLASMGEGTMFLETVVARDGSVSTVTLLDGDSDRAQPLLQALLRERFDPVRVHGRPVAVSVYRLINLTEVLARPLT
jgi:putative zinc finger protein